MTYCLELAGTIIQRELVARLCDITCATLMHPDSRIDLTNPVGAKLAYCLVSVVPCLNVQTLCADHEKIVKRFTKRN